MITPKINAPTDASVKNEPAAFPSTGYIAAALDNFSNIPEIPPISGLTKYIADVKIKTTTKMNAVLKYSARNVAFRPPNKVYAITPTGIKNAAM